MNNESILKQLEERRAKTLLDLIDVSPYNQLQKDMYEFKLNQIDRAILEIKRSEESI